MTKLSDAEVNKIADLAQIAIDKKDAKELKVDLTRILTFIKQMDAIDTKNVEPLAHPLDIKQRLRSDEVTETNQREEFLKLAPCTEAGLFLVPKVIE